MHSLHSFMSGFLSLISSSAQKSCAILYIISGDAQNVSGQKISIINLLYQLGKKDFVVLKFDGSCDSQEI